MSAPEAWQDDARCSTTDPEAFFPLKGNSPKPAKAVCGRCQVAEPCLQFALDNNLDYGVWGGATARQRRRMRAEGAA